MEILSELPNSVLWLSPNNRLAEESLVRKANDFGVEPTRLIFAERTDLTQHINRLRLADVALDTLLSNGGVTTSNALAVGVPVVTVLGERFASRMSASMLSAMGIAELVAADLQDYAELAIALARRPDWVTELRVRLQRNCQTSPLFDEKRFAKNLERAFLTMFEIFRAGDEPQAIWLRESN
jgi:protein O-GlcNAc transferase